MKKLLLILGLLFSASAAAQPSLLPYEDTPTYRCFEPNIGYGTKGVWFWYTCYPKDAAPPGSPSRVIWFAQPYPVRLDLIGARLETINKAADRKAAAAAAWKRFVNTPLTDPALLEVKKEMIEKDRVPIKP